MTSGRLRWHSWFERRDDNNPSRRRRPSSGHHPLTSNSMLYRCISIDKVDPREAGTEDVFNTHALILLTHLQLFNPNCRRLFLWPKPLNRTSPTKSRPKEIPRKGKKNSRTQFTSIRILLNRIRNLHSNSMCDEYRSHDE